MPRRRDVGFYAWLALIALLASVDAVAGAFLILGDRELSVSILMAGSNAPMILSLPVTFWACLSNPVSGRPGLAFSLGLLNHLLLPVPFYFFASLTRGLLLGWEAPSPLPARGEDLLIPSSILIALAAPYSLGAALIASLRENWISDERAILGLTLAFTSWFLAFGYFLD